MSSTINVIKICELYDEDFIAKKITFKNLLIQLCEELLVKHHMELQPRKLEVFSKMAERD